MEVPIMIPRPQLLIPFLVSLFSVFPAFSDFEGKVIGIADGDTISVSWNRDTIKVRLRGIDCPEQEIGRAHV